MPRDWRTEDLVAMTLLPLPRHSLTDELELVTHHFPLFG
jgi:hypothetical protein